MNGMNATYGFLPWLRRGVSTAIERIDGQGPAAPRATFPVTLVFNRGGTDGQVTADLELHGPGEIAGIDHRMIVRTYPSPDAGNVESNFFPLVEFDQPDFPWRYTPAAATADDRLTPWLVLVVLTDDEIEQTTATGPGGRLPAITVKSAASLPDLSQSWAWSHVHVTGLTRDTVADGSVGDEITRILAEEPERMVGRTMCPRYLRPKTAYRACLVPGFERGRLAGLHRTIDAAIDALQYAWRPDDAAVELPVYYQWRFMTGEAGDFESLVRRLLPARTLSTAVGRRDMDVSDPGAGLPSAVGNGRLPLEGALMSPASRVDLPPWIDREPFQARLAGLLNRPADLVDNGGSPHTVAPPLYGCWHAARRRVQPGAVASWFDELNADPRRRAVAGLGVQVVREQQQQLMAGAWEQVEGILEANKKLREAQLGCAVAARLLERDLLGLEPATVVQITAPLLTRILASPRTIRANLDDSPIAEGALDAAFRRATRPLGPVGRRQARTGKRSGRFGMKNATDPLLRMNRGDLPLTAPKAGARLTTLAAIGGRLAPDKRPWRRMLPFLLMVAAVLAMIGAVAAGIPALFWALIGVAAVAGYSAWRLRRATARYRVLAAMRDGSLAALVIERTAPPADFVPAERGFASQAAESRVSKSEAVANFRFAAARLSERLSDPIKAAGPKPAANLELFGDKILTAIHPEKTIAGAWNTRLRPPAGVDRDADDCGPIMAAPEFEQPMYEPLRDLSQDWLLPGVGQIPPDTVSLLETNQTFIESYMIGLNHEMGRELLWHEYPTDQRGTYFRQFWDVRGYAGPAGTDLRDIAPIAVWPAGSGLGSHRPTTPPVEGHLVLIIRGEVLRRYPNTSIYAVRAALEGPAPVASGGRRTLGQQERYPIFRGTLDPDITFIGFDLGQAEVRGNDESTRPGDQGWFFILQEQIAEPRFGLDVPDRQPGGPVGDWRALSWADLVSSIEELDALTYIDLERDARPVLPQTPAPPPEEPRLAWHARLGSRASDIACITLQSPYRVAIHGSDMLPGEEN